MLISFYDFNNVNNNFMYNLYNKYYLNIKGSLLYLFTNMIKTLKEAYIATRLSKLHQKRKRDNKQINKRTTPLLLLLSAITNN